MARILRTTFVMDAAQAANGTPDFDLPVNPLSVILLTVKALNNGATPALFTAVTSLLAAITDVRLTYRGANIIQGSLTDLAVLYGCLARWMPFGLNQQSADNAVRAITVPLCLGRRPYDPSECFPRPAGETSTCNSQPTSCRAASMRSSSRLKPSNC